MGWIFKISKIYPKIATVFILHQATSNPAFLIYVSYVRKTQSELENNIALHCFLWGSHSWPGSCYINCFFSPIYDVS